MELNIEQKWLEAGMASYWRTIEELAELSLEFEESEREFHGGDLPEAGEDALRAARRRRLEWFLFERDRGGRLVADLQLDRWRQLVDEEIAERAAMFLESWTGIFEVLRPTGDTELEARDLGGMATVRFSVPAGGPTLKPADLVVGRLFPTGDGAHLVSPAAGVFRSAALLTALGRDLQRLRREGAHAVLRLTQLELERMFFAAGSAGERSTNQLGQPRSALAEVEEFLSGGGVTPAIVDRWVQLLRVTPWQPEPLVSGAGDPVGDILDQLAFQTDLDLDRARALLLAFWSSASVHEQEQEPVSDAEDDDSRPSSVLDSLREFDRDRAAGLDLEASFRELEKRLGLDPEDGEDDLGAPDFPGVVGAMVEEFLWETERDEGADRRREREVLRAFGGYTEKLGVFENLTAREFLSFAAFWLPESRRLRSGAEAERLVDALLAFGHWAAENQGLEALSGTLGEQLASLTRSLPRAVVANALLPRDTQVAGELFEYCGPASPGCATVRDVRGEEREVRFEERLLAVLEDGDLFRGHTSDDGCFVVSCCYPPEAAGLRQSPA